MGYYTKFHFRAKLSFRLPNDIRILLRQQCKPWYEAIADHHYGNLPLKNLDSPFPYGDITAGFDRTFTHGQWDALLSGAPDHEFFGIDRASFIPWGGNGEDFPAPFFKEYPDGSSHLEFTCELKNIDQPIQNFLDWIKPYVRLRFGKRNRGRDKVWVGYYQPEDMRGYVSCYVKAVPTSEHPSMCGGRELIEDWSTGNFY